MVIGFQDEKVSVQYVLSIKPRLEQLIIVFDRATFREYIWQSRKIMFTYLYIGGQHRSVS
jgi:hypothetical protein